MDIRLVELNLDNIVLLETIRFKVFNINSTDFDLSRTYYAKEMLQGKYLVYGAYIDEKLIGACYVSNSWNSLYIEYLFVLPEYQHNVLHVGSSLMHYALEQKDFINNYYNTEFYQSYLDSANKTSTFYEKFGYTKCNVPNFMKKTLI